ncbi:spore coat U domain-containing protein [Diaphorobacter sp. HDW4B]|uniref:Csu type fimbrial protein n=1 Tax=Diaphorobacter sp. HDW4B TaxID=2714925 RepID=UPI00140CC8BD|nr:spore coat U domain-containing protein [Diaphorobacter sp. HDW4B]QIL72554.1 spore coat U domain-containing protein [Diaphorobacter sp. HDW4B]
MQLQSLPRRNHFMPCVMRMCVALLLLSPLAGWSQQCNSSGFGIAFGTVYINASASTVGSVPYNCQSNASNTYYKLCLMIPEGNIAATSGINPRRMTDYNGHEIAYNLYSDAAFTKIIGPPPSSAGYPDYTWDFMVPGGWSSPAGSVPVYAFIPTLPSSTTAGSYQAQFSNVTLKYAWSNKGTPSNCNSGGGSDAGTGTVIIGYNGTTATVSGSCQISLGKTISDLDFGSVSSLGSVQNSTTAISVSCPGSTTWKMGLSNGTYASGTQRRMKHSATANYINYELYRNSARTQRWGNDTTGGTDTVNGSGAAQTNPTVITVYGQVPIQTQPTSGNYSDAVTVTLVY